MRQIEGIGPKILGLVGAAVLLSLTTLVVLYTHFQEKAIFAQNERTMLLLIKSINQGLESVMLDGSAQIARNFSDRLKEIPEIVDFRIQRLTGEEAFLDNTTIYAVNRRLGMVRFKPRTKQSLVTFLAQDQKAVAQTIEQQHELAIYEEDAEGNRFLIYLAPIRGKDECQACHGEVKGGLGVAKLVTSLARVEEEIRHGRKVAGAFVLLSWLFIMGLTYLLIRRWVVRPVDQVKAAMAKVAGGDLNQEVPVLGRDELGTMAISFNHMTDQLRSSYLRLRQERDKLATTLLSTREGVVVTDPDGEVVLVNPAAERILGMTKEEVAQKGFYHILDDPEYIRSYIEHSGQGMPEVLVYKNHILNVYASTIHAVDGGVTGSALLLRNMTEMNRLEQQIQELSGVDETTGLLSRYRFDDLLVAEFRLYKRYNLETALLVVTMDRFAQNSQAMTPEEKNTLYRNMAARMRQTFRDVDELAFYGEGMFRILLHNTGFPGAAEAAERLRMDIERAKLALAHETVTVSVGVVISLYSHVETVAAWVGLAQQALAQVEAAGGNRVCFLGKHQAAGFWVIK